MATSGTYYLNGPTLSDATAVFSDAALTTPAADGFYSDGTVVREQVSGSLNAPASCPSCAQQCGKEITVLNDSGVFYTGVDTENYVGAIIIRFNPLTIPDGIITSFAGNQYNGVSSQNYGWLQGSISGEPTYVGDSSADCGLVANSPWTLTEYDYESTGYVDNGTTTNVTIAAGNIATTASTTGVCTMVIPKLNNLQTIMETIIYCPCEGSTFTIDIDCPSLLPSFNASDVNLSSVDVCFSSANETYYYVHVNGSGGVLGLYDMVFEDAYGNVPLSAGFYYTGSMSASYDYIKVDSNGVIVSFGICNPSQKYEVTRCNSTQTYVIEVAGVLALGVYLKLVEYPDCIFEVTATSTDTPTATIQSIHTGDCRDQCARYSFENISAGVSSVTYESCVGVTETIDIQPNDTVSFCLNNIVSINPAEVTETFVECGCEGSRKYTLRRCGDDLPIVAISTATLTIGQLVTVTDPAYSGCYFTVASSSTANAVTSIDTYDFTIECSDVCVEYSIENTGAVSANASYTDCDGNYTVVNVNAGQTVAVCAKVGTVSGEAILTINFNDCNC